MVRMRQPFFSIAAAAIFSITGLLIASEVAKGDSVRIGDLHENILWGMVGVMFLMAYFSLVHLKDK